MAHVPWPVSVFLAGVLLSCSSSPPNPVPAPTTTSATPVVIPSAMVEVPKAPRFPPLPANTTGLDAHLAYLARLCAPVVRVPHKTEVFAGCNCCPPFDTCRPKGPTPIDEAMDPSCVVEEVFRGSFRKPGHDEMAMLLYGCGSAATNEGGMIIASITDAAFENVEYREGLHPDTCTPMPREEGLDRLLCRFTHGRAHHSTHIFVVDFTRPTNRFADMEFIEIITQLPTVCQNILGQDIQHDHLDSMAVVDRNGDGLADIELVVTRQRGRVTKAMLAGCDDEKPNDRGRLLSKPKKYTLRWLGDHGRTFHPDAETSEALKHW